MDHLFSVDLSINHKEGDMYGNPIPNEKKISSEIILPYLKRYFMLKLEEAAYFNTPPDTIKTELENLAMFVRFTCGIHASLAFSNEVDRLKKIPTDEFNTIVKKVLN